MQYCFISYCSTTFSPVSVTALQSFRNCVFLEIKHPRNLLQLLFKSIEKLKQVVVYREI